MAYIDVDEPAPADYQPPAGQVEQSPKQPKQRRDTKKRLVYAGIIVAALFVGVQFNRLNNQAKQLQQQVNGQSTTEKAPPDQEATSLATEIGQYLDLPNETPTVATVTDANKVKEQAFFTSAQNGDKVLLFERSKRAVLYRPSTKKVIEFATTN